MEVCLEVKGSVFCLICGNNLKDLPVYSNFHECTYVTQCDSCYTAQYIHYTEVK